VVNVELTCVLWLEPAVFTKVLLVDCVRVLTLNDVALVDGFTSVPAVQGLGLVPQLESCGTTDRARSRAICFVVIRKLVVHPQGKEL
jgi:hypothetical protein